MDMIQEFRNRALRSLSCALRGTESVTADVDEMGGRIIELEKSIDNLRAEMGIEGSPSLAPSKTKEAQDSG